MCFQRPPNALSYMSVSPARFQRLFIPGRFSVFPELQELPPPLFFFPEFYPFSDWVTGKVCFESSGYLCVHLALQLSWWQAGSPGTFAY